MCIPGENWQEPECSVVTEHLLEVVVHAEAKSVLVGPRVENRRSERLYAIEQ
jgi:hypothetical protein